MADHDVIRKLRIYRALYRLNRAFVHIARNLDHLLVAEAFKDDIPDQDNPRGWQDQIALIQMEINRQLTENLHRMEHGDIRHLARIEAIDPKVQELYFGKDRRNRAKSQRNRA